MDIRSFLDEYLVSSNPETERAAAPISANSPHSSPNCISASMPYGPRTSARP